MITIRKGTERGHTDLGWLDSYHTFSFGDYFDPRNMGYRDLRVINEDRVQPSKGFGTHAHRDMEIISYVLEGALEHKDSMGTGSIIRPGDVQLMSAGTGVTHSEFNPSPDEVVHFLQIWIIPDRIGLKPGYQQKSFAATRRKGKLCLVASPDGREGSLTIHQKAEMHAALLGTGEQVSLPIKPGRSAWVQVASGSVSLDGALLAAGDGASVADGTSLTVRATQPSEVIVFSFS
ncbi:MAG TPA: pirin family protein [Patescibacteria group bacterium]|nr:pirin family protein [Patescibacteria group bacterium]